MSFTELHHGDCLDVLARMPSASVSAIVTDPPYGIAFMGRKWDYQVPSVAIWEQCLRVLKPGGHLLAFAGTRTQHRMCVNIEDAGFEIRDMIAWVYGSGFPKSMNVAKAIDATLSTGKSDSVALRVRDGRTAGTVGSNMNKHRWAHIDDSQAMQAKELQHSEAQQWDGWGTALKPALEPIAVARKPFIGTVAGNVLEHGTGAMNIDGCRVEAGSDYTELNVTQGGDHFSIGSDVKTCGTKFQPASGRWPANLIHDGSDEVTQLFPQTGPSKSGGKAGWQDQYVGGKYKAIERTGYDDNGGSAARFFYTAKASKDDRDKGNTHPTVKPTDLMAYLCRLVTPVGGTVLDPFMGSGTTGKAALSEGFSFIGIERDPEYYAICESRFDGAQIGLALAV